MFLALCRALCLFVYLIRGVIVEAVPRNPQILSVQFTLSFDSGMYLCSHHLKQNINHSHRPREFPSCPSPSKAPSPLPLSDVSHRRLALPAVDLRRHRNLQCGLFCASWFHSGCCVCHLFMLTHVMFFFIAK